MKQHDGKDDETGVRIDPSKVFVSGVCPLNVYVCVCVCSDTPQGERVCHDNKKSTLKKAQSQSLNSKNKLLHVHFWLTIHAKVETALKFRRHLNPKP